MPKVIFLALLAAVAGDVLAPGSPAPKVDVRTWIKGTPVNRFEKGRTYMVEFWASWCGPCHEAIPEVTAIANDFPDVQVVGIGVWEPNDKGQVQAFVKAMGPKMGYSVAYSGDKDRMAKTWLDAAKQNGIPATFIVSNQKIAWIGHPSGARKSLESILTGKFDMEAAKTRYLSGVARREREQQAALEISECDKLFVAGQEQEARARLEKVKNQPEAAHHVKEIEFLWLAKSNFEEWKRQCLDRVQTSEDERSTLSSFANQNALRYPEAAGPIQMLREETPWR